MLRDPMLYRMHLAVRVMLHDSDVKEAEIIILYSLS